MIKTFRGQLPTGGQNRIRLQTIKGKVGYRITMFRIVPITPSTLTTSTMMIWKNEQATVPTSTAIVDFTDSDLLGVAVWMYTSGEGNVQDNTIFDNEIFNQDIYITHTEPEGGYKCNYYIELEIIPLDDAGAEYTTLKDMRQPG